MSVGIGIAGFAHGHVGMYCRRWASEPELGVEVVGGWDWDAERLAKSCESLKAQAYPDLDALLREPRIKAVAIGAETSRHAELVERAAAAGKAIILQKPMALTMTEADRIVAAVERHGVPFTMAWQMRVDPQNLKIQELLAAGTLGRVFMLRRRHGLPLQHMSPPPWHTDPRHNRDIWADDASHAIDFILWLLGKPESVTAEIVSLRDPKIPMDNGVALFRYPGGGPLAEVCCSFSCVAAENAVEVICEKGSIIQNYGDIPSCNVPRPEGACGLKWYMAETKQWVCSDIASPANHGWRIGNLAGPLAEFVRGQRPAIATAQDGRDALRMTLACYVSVREGRRVSIGDPAIAEI